MSTENILAELRQPFHPSHITWKPQAISKDKTKAMACAYGDLRAYQNRLDEVCGLDWSVTYTPWGETKVVCHLTINGVTRSSTGESDSQSERSEIGGTAAEAQAFKRAAAMFGLGRYLYDFPTTWVEYDEASRGFKEQAKAKLEGLVVQHYRRYMEQAKQNNSSTTDNKQSSVEQEIEKIIGGWQKPSDAMGWAVDKKYTENEHSARTRFKAIVDSDFGGKCTTANQSSIFRAYATHYLNKENA